MRFLILTFYIKILITCLFTLINNLTLNVPNWSFTMHKSLFTNFLSFSLRHLIRLLICLRQKCDDIYHLIRFFFRLIRKHIGCTRVFITPSLIAKAAQWWMTTSSVSWHISTVSIQNIYSWADSLYLMWLFRSSTGARIAWMRSICRQTTGSARGHTQCVFTVLYHTWCTHWPIFSSHAGQFATFNFA